MNPRQKDNLVKQISDLISKSGDGFNREAAEQVVTTELKDKKFDELFFSPNGFVKIAQAMKKPLKKKLDYVGVSRRILEVDPLPIGEIPAYDRDIKEFQSVKVAYKGAPPVVETDIDRVQIPTFKININEKVDYEDILMRRYPVFDRAKDRVAIATAIAEDNELFSLLNTAATVGPNPELTATSIEKGVLADAYGEIAAKQLQPGAILMNPYNYKDILKWKSDDLDQVTLNEILDTGQVGSIWNTLLVVSTKIPVNTVYATTTPSKLGIMPERKNLEVKIWDYPPQGYIAVIGLEVIGMGIYNTAGVVKISIVPGT